MSNFPVPPPMEVKDDLMSNWSFFRDQWEDYEIATGLNDKDKTVRVATLRSVMGRECLQILKNLDITEDDRKDPKKCIDALENYFKPTRNEIYERYIFYSSDQGPNETIDQWVTRLRQLTKSCNFENMTDSLLRDRIVLGTKDKAARARMFRDKAVDLHGAIDQLRASEIAAHQIRTIEQETSNEDAVHFTKTGSKKHLKDDKSKEKIKCMFCLQLHRFGRKHCPAHGTRCNTCHERNHWAGSKKCTQKGKLKTSKNAAHYVEYAGSSSDESCSYINHQVANIRSRGRQPKVTLLFKDKGKMDRTPCQCLMDTGTTCNIMSIENLNKLIPDAQLWPSNTKLHFYDGSYMKPLGVYSMYAKHKDKQLKLRFEIVTTRVTRQPLLSTNTCEKLGLITIHNDEQSEASGTHREMNFSNTDASTDPILEEFKDVFEGLGCLPGKVHLECDHRIKPVQHTPRNVPIATKEELREKIDHMEAAGIIKKVVTPTEWISSMVAVRKPGKLRICIDPKDLNKALKRNHYLMPTIEDILPS